MWITYLMAFVSIVLGSVAQLLLKMAMTVTESEGIVSKFGSALADWKLWGGLACYGFSMLFWLYVLSKLELSLAYPLVSMGYILTLIIGWLILDEPMTVNKVIGVALICVGVVVLSR